MDEKDEIRIINENETLEEIYDFLDDITYKVENISGSVMNIYQILHKLEKISVLKNMITVLKILNFRKITNSFIII